MERYLVFELSEDDARRSDFADYTLGNTSLLPRYFGEIAPVNIFLGENNSGKSRFMREIMRHDPARVLDLTIMSTLKELVIDGCKVLDSVATSNLHKIEVIAHPPMANNPGLRSLLFEDQPSYNAVVTADVLECKDIIRKLFDLLLSALKSPHLFLAAIQDQETENIVIQLKSNVNLIQRVVDIYEAQTNGLFNGTHYQVVNDKALYHSDEINLSFLGVHEGELFKRPGFVGDTSIHAPVNLRYIIAACEPILEVLSAINKQQIETRSRTYLPILRTARTMNFSGAPADFIADIISRDYALQNSGVLISSGLQLHVAVDSKKNSDFEDRKEFRKFEAFLEETFFNGKQVEVVYKRIDSSVLVRVDQEERALPYLGDGIQAIVLLLYPLFTAKKGSWFFIEEPEGHLHPGFQRIFIKTIATHPALLEKQLTIFLTTHSNHMLDFALDEAKNINLFTFNKTVSEAGKANYQIQLTAPHDLKCLTALGVQNSSVFLSNCTLWVEGITDRIYLKAYLKAYLSHKKHTYSLLEGLHYSFLEYAGANVSHYTFGAKAQQVTITDEALNEIQALSISNRIMLIADQDAGKETKHSRLTSQQHAGFEYVVLSTREIENLLTPEVIVIAIKKLYPKQADNFDAGQLKQGQYKSTYLARYLQGKFTNLPASFIADSGTIASAKKRQFAEAASEAITAWDMLSDDAKKLTEQVFKFIMGHNPRLGSN
jgi:hypothetical protein